MIFGFCFMNDDSIGVCDLDFQLSCSFSVTKVSEPFDSPEAMAETRAHSSRKEALVRDLDESRFGRSNHAAVRNRFRSSQAFASLTSDPKFGKCSGLPNTYADATQTEKLYFPRFNGDKIQEWLVLVEQFFEIDRTMDELKVGLASVHLDALATTCHQSLSQSVLWDHVKCNWGLYKMLLEGKYYKLMDDIAELKQLHETEGIEEYHEKFVLIKSRLDLSESYLVSVYLEGLRSDTQRNVRMFQPQTIQQCLMIGRLYETAHPTRVITKKESDDFPKAAQLSNLPKKRAFGL